MITRQMREESPEALEPGSEDEFRLDAESWITSEAWGDAEPWIEEDPWIETGSWNVNDPLESLALQQHLHVH